MKKLLVMMMAVFTLVLGSNVDTAEAKDFKLVGYMGQGMDYIYIDVGSAGVSDHSYPEQPYMFDEMFVIHSTYYSTEPDKVNKPLYVVYAVGIKGRECSVQMYNSDKYGNAEGDPIDSFTTTSDKQIFSVKMFLSAWDAIYGNDYPFDVLPKEDLDLALKQPSH
jgi:hypothetical protein